MENNQGKLLNPPSSPTIVGTAVARIVASIATRPVVTMIAMRIGPRSERKPTPEAVAVLVRVLSCRRRSQRARGPHIPGDRLVDLPSLNRMATDYPMTGFLVRDHRVEVPVDWSAPDRFGSIEVFARELVDPTKATDDLPLLVYLQGGPGHEAPRPLGGGWLGTALE